MSLEDIGTVEALLCSRSTARAEAADHSALVVSESVPVLVVLPGEALDVVFAGRDRALLWPFVLVGKHVCLQVLEHASALGEWAETLLACLIVQLVTTTTLAACA